MDMSNDSDISFWKYLFFHLPKGVDRKSRYLDRRVSSIYDSKKYSTWNIHGHPAMVLVLMFPVFYYLSFGPTFDAILNIFNVETTNVYRSYFLLACVFFAMWFLWLVRNKVEGQKLLWLQLSLMCVVAAVSFWGMSSADSVEADNIPYRHSFTLLYLIIFGYGAVGSQVAACLLLSGLITKYKDVFTEQLKSTELFVHEKPRDMGAVRIFHGLLNGPLYNLLHFLFLPAVVALILPRGDFYNSYVYISIGVSLLLVAWGAMYHRWRNMINIVRSWFFTGGQLLVSLLVIILAVLRFCDVDYVATILDNSPWGNLSVVSYIFGLYVIFWLYEYWINRVLMEHLLLLLGRPIPGFSARVTYPYNNEITTHTKVKHTNRFLQIHGSRRFILIGDTKGEGENEVAFHAYDKIDLFEKLMNHAKLKNGETQDTNPTRDAFNAISKRVKLYYSFLNFIAVVTIGFSIWYWNANVDIKPVVTINVDSVSAESGVDLLNRLKQQQEKLQPAIAIAASGGGTRAALYTASLLRGIAQNGDSENIILTSGVSGGGAALAYYAAHYPIEISEGSNEPDGWLDFSSSMSKPFIRDVIEGGSRISHR